MAGRLFRERRAVPWWWWIVAVCVAVPSVEVVAVLGPHFANNATWGLAVLWFFVAVVAVAAILLALSTSDVEVESAGLRAGRDRLPASAIGRVRQLDRAGARRVLGRDARADARLSIRPWVHTAVQIEVVDPARPEPYWVVGTRRPGELAAVLDTLRDGPIGHERADTRSAID